MSTADFATLPLHDAVLHALHVNWADRTCIADVAAFIVPRKDAEPKKIVWRGVTAISVPHEDPWGPSTCVNAVRQEQNCYIIQMQSGEEIRITEESLEFS